MVSWRELQDCQPKMTLPIVKIIRALAEMFVEISAPPAPPPPCQLSCNEFTDREKQRLRGRVLATRPQMPMPEIKSLTLQANGFLRACLRDCSWSYSSSSIIDFVEAIISCGMKLVNIVN